MHCITKGCGCGAWKWPRRRTGTRTGRAQRSRDRRSRCSAKTYINVIRASRTGQAPTSMSGNPKAEPKMMPRRASQPIVKRTAYGSLKNGVCTQGTQTAAMGRETTVAGMNRKAMTLHRDLLSANAIRYGFDDVLSAPPRRFPQHKRPWTARTLPSSELRAPRPLPLAIPGSSTEGRDGSHVQIRIFAMVPSGKGTHTRKNQAQMVWTILEDVTGGTSQSRVTIEEKSGAMGRTIDAGWPGGRSSSPTSRG